MIFSLLKGGDSLLKGGDSLLKGGDSLLKGGDSLLKDGDFELLPLFSFALDPFVVFFGG